MKALRLVVLSQVSPAVVTGAEFDEVDGLRVDADLLDAAGIFEHEKVEVLDTSTGTRLSCPVRRSRAGSGDVVVCGATALLIKPGARVTLATSGWMKEKQAFKHDPIRVHLDDDNHLAAPPKKAKAD